MKIKELKELMEDETKEGHQGHQGHQCHWEHWEQIKFEVSYFFSTIRSNFGAVKVGCSNFWKWRKIIWHDRWYDYSFLHEILRFKLDSMAQGYKGCHYVDCGKDQKEIQELVEMLDEIERLESSWEDGYSAKIDELYQEFGRRLFDIKDYENEHEGKKYTTSFSSIRKFWD